MTSEGEARSRVVVGVDGSDGSVAALRWAARYGAATGTPVRVVLAWHFPTVAGFPPTEHLPEGPEKQVEGRETSILSEAIAKAAPDTSGAQIDPAIAYGHPVEVLVEESRNADLLVVGRRGHSGFLGRHLGSVSLHCVTDAVCPVVVVHHQ